MLRQSLRETSVEPESSLKHFQNPDWPFPVIRSQFQAERLCLCPPAPCGSNQAGNRDSHPQAGLQAWRAEVDMQGGKGPAGPTHGP